MVPARARSGGCNLGWAYLDSGALYRGRARAHERGLDDADGATARLVEQLDVAFRPVPDAPPRVLLAGRDVTDAIRSEQSGNAASRVGALPEVRAALWVSSAASGARRTPVADGRDMGTRYSPAYSGFLAASGGACRTPA